MSPGQSTRPAHLIKSFRNFNEANLNMLIDITNAQSQFHQPSYEGIIIDSQEDYQGLDGWQRIYIYTECGYK